METMDERGDVPSQQCSNCDSLSARSWCLDCNEALCDDCVSAHRRVTLTRWHRLLNQESNGSGFVPPTKFCKLHPSEALKLFCLTCVQLTCRDCQLESHKNHRFSFVSSAVEGVQLLLQKQLDAYMQLLKGKMEASARSLQDMETRLKFLVHCEFILTTDLQRVFKTLVQLLKRRIEVLIKEIQKVYESEREMISGRMLVGKILQESHGSLRDITEKARNTTDPLVLMSYIEQMKPRVKDLMNQEFSPPPSMTHLRIITDSTFLEGLVNFGKLEVSWVPFSVSEKIREGMEKRPTPVSSSSSLTVTPPTTSSQPLPCIKTNSNRVFSPVPSGASSTTTSFSSSDFSSRSESSTKTNLQTGTSSGAVPSVHQSCQPLSSSSISCSTLTVSGPSQVTSVSPSSTSHSSSVRSAICPPLSQTQNICDNPRTTASHHSVSASPSILTTLVPPVSSLRSPAHTQPFPRTTTTADINTPLPSSLISFSSQSTKRPTTPTKQLETTTKHPETLKSHVTTIKRPETLESHMTTIKRPETLESHMTTIKRPETLESHTIKHPETLENHMTTIKHPETLENHMTTIKHPETLESHTIKHPETLESHTIKHPETLENHTIKHPETLENHTIKHPETLENHTIKHPETLESHTIKHPETLENHTTTTKHSEASKRNATAAHGSFYRFNILTKSKLELDSGKLFCKFRYKEHRTSKTSLSTRSSGGKPTSVPPKNTLSSSFTSSSCIVTSSITCPTSSISSSSSESVQQWQTQTALKTVEREKCHPLNSTVPSSADPLPNTQIPAQSSLVRTQRPARSWYQPAAMLLTNPQSSTSSSTYVLPTSNPVVHPICSIPQQLLSSNDTELVHQSLVLNQLPVRDQIQSSAALLANCQPAVPHSLSSYFTGLSSPVQAVPSFSSVSYHFLPQTFSSTVQPLTSILPPGAGPNPFQSSQNLNQQRVLSQNQPALSQLKNTQNAYQASGSGLNPATALPQFPVLQNGSALHSVSTVQKSCNSSQFSLDSLVPQSVQRSTTENVCSVTQCSTLSNQQTQTNKVCALSDSQVLSHQNQTSNSRFSLQQNLLSKMVTGSSHSVQDQEVQQESEVDKQRTALFESTRFRENGLVQKLYSPETAQIKETTVLSEETDSGGEQLSSKTYQIKQNVTNFEEIQLIIGPFSPPSSDIKLTITSLEETDPPDNQSSSKARDVEPVSTNSEKNTCFDGLISPVSSDDELTLTSSEKTQPIGTLSSSEVGGIEGVAIRSEETEMINRQFSPISSDDEAIILSEETKPTRRFTPKAEDGKPITNKSKENKQFGEQGSPSEETNPQGNQSSSKANDVEPVSTKSKRKTCFDGLISPVSSDDELTIASSEETQPIGTLSSSEVGGIEGVAIRSEETEMINRPFSPISSDDEAIILSEETKPTRRLFTPKAEDGKPITNESKESKQFGGQVSPSEETNPQGNQSSSKAHVSTKSKRKTCFDGLISLVSLDDKLTIVSPEKTKPTGRPSSPEVDGIEGITVRSEETEMDNGLFLPISSEDEFTAVLPEDVEPTRRWYSPKIDKVEPITNESKENNPIDGQASGETYPSGKQPSLERYDAEHIPAKSDQTKVGGSSFSPGSSDDETTNDSSEDDNLALNLSSSETLDSEDEDSPSPKAVQQDFSQPQWQPKVSLVRLPVSVPRHGSPLPSFHFMLGETKEEIYLQEFHVSNYVSDATNDDFIYCPSSPESPLSVEVISCSACGSPNATKICSDCGRGYHNDCHIPPVGSDIWSEWICSLCQDLTDPSDPYSTDRTPSPASAHLSIQDKRRCETLLLHLKVEGCGQFSELDFWTNLMFVSERLTHHCPPPYQTAAQLVADLWMLFQDASQDDALLKFQQSFQKKLVEVLGGQLHPSLLMTPPTNDPVPSSNGDGSPIISATGNILQSQNKNKENFSSGTKLNGLRKRLREFLDLNRTSAAKRPKES